MRQYIKMKRVPRKKRPVEKGLPQGYDSKWEYDLHQEELQHWEHHKGIIEYSIPHKYHPDFIRIIGKKIIYPVLHNPIFIFFLMS